MPNENDILEQLLVEGTKKFSKPRKSERALYGKINGRDDLLAFFRYINPGFETPEHIQLIAQKLTAVAEGKIRRLIINMPPRHGKTEICSKTFPIWYLGKLPDKQIIITSYNATRAEDLTRWGRNTCEDVFYHDIFPEVLLRQDSRAKDQWQTIQGGQVIGAGVSGPITGRGADLAIIDDPLKDYQDAISETIEDAIWDWYLSTLHTRLHPGAAVILIMTRWLTTDLAGRLIAEQGLKEYGGVWDLLKLPALSPQGKALWPERYNEEALLEIRKTMGEKLFSALYQQEPVDLIEREFANPVFGEPPKNLKKIAFLDPAFGGSDFCAFVAGGILYDDDDDSKYTIPVTAGEIWRSPIDETYNRVERLMRTHEIGTIYVESNQAQKAVAAELRRRGLNARDVPHITNKHLRIVNAVKVNWDRLRFSKAVSQEFLKQLLNYSELARHDDAADALAGLVECLGMGGARLAHRYDGFMKSLIRRW